MIFPTALPTTCMPDSVIEFEKDQNQKIFKTLKTLKPIFK